MLRSRVAAGGDAARVVYDAMKQFSQACENNKGPILDILHEAFRNAETVLEIGSGTGQHAVWFAGHLPHLVWQTSDLAVNHPGIRAWIAEAGLPNLRQPLVLDVSRAWPLQAVDGVFSANTAHIMAWREVQAMFAGVARLLEDNARFCLYGPFNYGGEYTSDSNARFDASLRAQDPRQGIRDLEDLQRLGDDVGLRLFADHPMPANNRTLVWAKRAE